jgi:hypothetical protein
MNPEVVPFGETSSAEGLMRAEVVQVKDSKVYAGPAITTVKTEMAHLVETQRKSLRGRMTVFEREYPFAIPDNGHPEVHRSESTNTKDT